MCSPECTANADNASNDALSSQASQCDLNDIFEIIEEAYQAGIIGINEHGEIELILDLFSTHLQIHIKRMPHIHHDQCNTWCAVDTVKQNRCPYCHKVLNY
jgi:peptide subunit release factor RF-3